MAKVLKYFDLNGLAEPIRYILLYTNQKFEDVRYDYKSWPIKEIKDDVVNYDIIHSTPEKREEMKKKLFDEFLDFYFSRFEKQLKDNNGCFGGKLSWADFVFVGILECENLFLQEELQTGYPAITRLMETIHSLPRVKEYIRDRKPYERF